MTNAKHTPGPWRVQKTLGCKDITSDERDEYGNKSLICTTAGREEREDRANARLIAAAPELLAACKQALACLNHAPRFSTPQGVDSYDTAALLDRVINKAEPKGGE